MRPFARFHSAENHEKLVNGLCNELRIRKRIEELQNYRLNGIRTFAEITSLENQKNQKKTLKPQTTLTRKRGYSESNDSENKKDFELDEVEESLCESLGLEKQDYTKIKEAIERETFIKGMIDKNDEEALITIKIHKTLQQMNFFISKDWDFKGERVKPKEKI
ncbi:Transcriptional adapter 2-alpha, variant 2 [Bonamia ostreae]|uniref:Transcriptional adapter 2-alpha, variant 2 n=1 Tax=Bonamia ostreae TaxID=126728 RepID=A0ABV2AT39_9EUKA